MTDTKSRSLIKAVSYRVFGSVTTAAIALWFIGDLKSAAGVGAADLVSKVLLYYLHERLWDHLPFGRTRAPEYEI